MNVLPENHPMMQSVLRFLVVYSSIDPKERVALTQGFALGIVHQQQEIEKLARDLLARLSYDYGDSEDCPEEIAQLFERGEQLLPFKGE